jgi:hypothetical protein
MLDGVSALAPRLGQTALPMPGRSHSTTASRRPERSAEGARGQRQQLELAARIAWPEANAQGRPHTCNAGASGCCPPHLAPATCVEPSSKRIVEREVSKPRISTVYGSPSSASGAAIESAARPTSPRAKAAASRRLTGHVVHRSPRSALLKAKRKSIVVGATSSMACARCGCPAPVAAGRPTPAIQPQRELVHQIERGVRSARCAPKLRAHCRQLIGAALGDVHPSLSFC